MVALAAVLVAPAPAVAQDSPDEVRRLAGDTRITTAVAVSEATFTSADTALLARADNYPDALTGTVLAHQRQAPLLLTDRDRVPNAVTAELERLGVEQVILLGGTTAVSNAVRDDLAADYRVSRVSGPTRWATAVEVAEAAAPSPDTVILATGEKFPDAVAVSAYAAHQGWPVLLTGQNELPDEVRDYLNAAGSVRVVPVGGHVAIADAVLAELEADGHDVAPRLAGPTRWATSHRIATVHANALGAPTDLWVATGEAFPDALTAGVAAAASGGLLQLTPTNTIDVPDTDRDVLGRLERQSACDDSGTLTDVVLVGGLVALTDAVRFQAQTAVSCTEPPPGLMAWAAGEEVWVSEPGGANARVAADGVTASGPPQFSPDLNRLIVHDSRNGSLAFVNTATGAVREQPKAYGGEWSPDGTLVAYSDYEDIGDSDFGSHINIADADGSNPRRLVESERGYIHHVVDWSADGSEVFYFSGYDDVDAPNRLSAVNVETGDTREISRPDEWMYYYFSPSPDRTQMTVIETDLFAEGDPDVLWLIDVATGAKQHLYTSSGLGSGRWSPDGTELAVPTRDGPVRIDIATGAVTPIPRDEDVLDWSPDGAHILMSEDEGNPTERLVAVDADGTGATVLTDYLKLTRETFPVWSPDGRWVAYVGNDGNIHQVSVDGQHRFQVSTEGGQSPAWAEVE